MNLKSLVLAASAAVLSLPAAAVSASPPACAASDLSGVSVISCVGYAPGNLINGNAGDRATVDAFLAGLGLSGTGGIWIEKLEGLNGSSVINFAAPLSGVSYLGIHRGGAGNGGQGTAFYSINAGANLDTITYNLDGSSNAALYMTTAVPEPQAYALMLAGLVGIAGFVRQRRRSE